MQVVQEFPIVWDDSHLVYLQQSAEIRMEVSSFPDRSPDGIIRISKALALRFRNPALTLGTHSGFASTR